MKDGLVIFSMDLSTCKKYPQTCMRAPPGFRLTTSALAAQTRPPGRGRFLMVTEEEEVAEVTGLTEVDRDHTVLGARCNGARQLSAGAPRTSCG
jgi:hypothetical protein